MATIAPTFIYINWMSKGNHLTALKVFTEIKKILLQKIEAGSIAEERFQQIMSHVTSNLFSIEETDVAMREFCLRLAKQFPEINAVEIKFRFEELEKIDRQVAKYIGLLVNKGDFELAERAMKMMQASPESRELLLGEFKKMMPVEYEGEG